ncbi:1-acylglycerol-3-phosphate O-acyltransferase [Hyella patelloides]
MVNPILYTYFRGRVYGAEKIPRSGSYIVVSNHASNLDPLILAVAVCRPVSFMAKEELFRIPVLKKAIALCGGYPVKRDTSDLAAIKSAINFINQGWLSGIFLEGTRTTDGKINDPKLGAALIAAKTETPLIPASIWGTEKVEKSPTILRPTPITIRFGDTIAPPTSRKKADLQAVTEHCTKVIHQMHALGR